MSRMPKLITLTGNLILTANLMTIKQNFTQVHQADSINTNKLTITRHSDAEVNENIVTDSCGAHCHHLHHRHHPWRHDARPYWQPWYDNPRYYWPGFNASVMAGNGATGGCYSQWERDHLNGWVKVRYCY